MFNAALQITDHGHMAFEASTSRMLSGSFIHSGTANHVNCRQTLPSSSSFSTMPEDSLNHLYSANHGGMIDNEVPISRIMPHVGNTSLSGSNGSTNFPEHFMGASVPSFANFLSSTTSLHESLSSFGIAPTSALPSEELRTSGSNGSCTTLNSSISASQNFEFGLQTSKKDEISNGHVTSGWNLDDVSGHQIPSSRTTSMVRPSYRVVGGSEFGWVSDKSPSNYDPSYYFAPSNELSLSLGSSQLSVINFPSVPDQCSEVSGSGINHDANRWHDHSYGMVASSNGARLLDKGLELQHMSANREGLLLYRDSSSGFGSPSVTLESKFLHATQEILAEIASYALGDLDIDDPHGGTEIEAKMPSSSSCIEERGQPLVGSGKFPITSGESSSLEHMDPLPSQPQETDTRKSELSIMLQKVC